MNQKPHKFYEKEKSGPHQPKIRPNSKRKGKSGDLGVQMEVKFLN